jgi:mandelate racemase
MPAAGSDRELSSNELTIRAVATQAFSIPLRIPLGTSAAVVREAPFLLIDLQTKEGITGRCYLFCYTTSGARAIAAHLHEAVGLIAGQSVSPKSVSRALSRRFTLLGVTGTARMALSALDVALWDALAISLNLPLARLLGAAPATLPAYNSNGLGLMPPEAAADEAELLLASGFEGIKLRLGHPGLEQDLSVTRAVRRRIGENISLMVDYNQALDTAEALVRGGALQHEGVYWLEEPIRHDDYRGNSTIAKNLDLPLQIGENLNGPEAMIDALEAQACDLVMPDMARIGGVTGWIEAAAIAADRGVPLSSHLFPEVSAHLLSASPTAHWLEYVDWADAVLEQPLEIINGRAVTPDRPGAGLAWDPRKLAKLRPL